MVTQKIKWQILKLELWGKLVGRYLGWCGFTVRVRGAGAVHVRARFCPNSGVCDILNVLSNTEFASNRGYHQLELCKQFLVSRKFASNKKYAKTTVCKTGTEPIGASRIIELILNLACVLDWLLNIFDQILNIVDQVLTKYWPTIG